MASIQIVASGLLGGLFSWLELARRLEADGHRVTLCAPEARRETVADGGIAFLPIAEPPVDFFAPYARPNRPGLRERSLAGRRRRRDQALAGFDLNPFRASLKAAAPDLLLIDCELHPHILIALGQGHRVALLSSMLPGIAGLRAPPLDNAIVPGRGLRGSPAGVTWAWLRFWAWSARVHAATRLKFWGGDQASVLRHLARLEGVDTAIIDPMRWQLPWGYRLPTLIPHARELDLPSGHRPLLRYIGPMIPEGPAPGAATEASAFLDRVRAEGVAPRFVYAGFGSMVGAPPALEATLVELFRRRPDWRLLLVTRTADGTAGSDDLPPNVCRVGWAPQTEALELAALSISHGGINTITESMAAGVPALVFPVLDLDQRGNAARVAFHGLGEIGSVDTGVEGLGEQIDRLARAPEVRAALDAARLACARYRRERVAEREVAALLAADDGPPPGHEPARSH